MTPLQPDHSPVTSRPEAERDEMLRELERLRREVDDLECINAQLLNDVRRLQEEIADRDRTISGIYAGRIWRLARPLFELHRLLGRVVALWKKPAKQHVDQRADPGQAESDVGARSAAEEEVARDESEMVAPRGLVLAPADGNRERRVAQSPSDLYDVLCFSVLDWDFAYQRPHQLAAQFARLGHRVFYVSPGKMCPPDSPAAFTLHEQRERLYEVLLANHRPMNLCGGELAPEKMVQLLASVDSLRRLHNIVHAVILVQLPFWRPLAIELRRRFAWTMIYDCMDEWSGFPGWDDSVNELESRLVDECDLLLVSSSKLLGKWDQRKAGSCVLVRNACNYEHFRRARPNDLLDGVARPIVGYFGAIAEWFDFDLLAFLARSRPQYSFVLLGWPASGIRLKPFESLPNVRFLGRQAYSILPYYLYNFDACIIPFLANRTTESVDPVKFYEYISLGKPVVAIGVPELCEYRKHLYIADDHRDFLAKLDVAVAESDPEMVRQRIELARQNTWEARVEIVKQSIERIKDEYAFS